MSATDELQDDSRPRTFADVYRRHPEGFRRLAEKADGELRERMLAAIEDGGGE